ncbi:MAG: DUF4065 domain-containing protein [Reyranella sp.]|uniref:Panacea domain-containing protein n=1 Tax=Reyranella sp. TaxID=1929291 RepID=UPI0012019EA8|nr:Panacea domain-containing protein [Reyranella sp.]TAJ39006.1 MAG: DUF4065 domain-containing protein [Reyranella sp.]
MYTRRKSATPPSRSTREMHQFDRQKFKALIHYVINRCPPEHVGKTKLNKAGFYADMICYLQLGRPMTGETYARQSHGPVAEHLQSCLRELIAEGDLDEKLVPYFGFSKYEYIARRPPNMSAFSDAEMKLVDEVADFVCLQNSARSISELSHTEAWECAAPGEELPYFAATQLLPADVEEDDRAWGAAEMATLAAQKPRYKEVRGKSLRDVCGELSPPPRRRRAAS